MKGGEWGVGRVRVRGEAIGLVYNGRNMVRLEKRRGFRPNRYEKLSQQKKM